MAAVKLLSICLLLILVIINIGDVRAKCTPIALNVKAEFSESSLRKDYKHTRLVTSSSSFRQNFDKIDVSASLSGSYGGFSAEASASFSEVSESASSTTKSRDETKTSEVTYAPGQNHIIRKLSKTVTIDGRSASVITQDFVDVIAVEDSPSYSQLRKMGEDYIAYNYGGISGGKIRNNVYTASACVTDCRRTYQGGCGNWEEKLLNSYDDREYTVSQCHVLCDKEPLCAGFFVGRYDKRCQLYREGCTYSNNDAWDYYAMADCSIGDACTDASEECQIFRNMSVRAGMGRELDVSLFCATNPSLQSKCRKTCRLCD